jgi:hypothetical protein
VVEWSFFGTTYESTITNTYWGTIDDLHEVVAMYRAGQIRPEIEHFPMDQALEAYRRLEAGSCPHARSSSRTADPEHVFERRRGQWLVSNTRPP